MRKKLPLFLSSLCCIFFLLASTTSKASHIVGADLFYTHIAGLQYKITVILYGDCGPSSSAAFSTLPTGSPKVCVFNGSAPTATATLSLTIEAPSAGTEITPVCPSFTYSTQCTNPSFATPGIKKFVYSTVYTFPSTSAAWRLVFNGNHGSSTAGRAAAITNLPSPGTMQLIDTLDNRYMPNSSAILTVVPTPFFCLDDPTCYNPGAVDAEGDSLRFALIQPTNGTGACGAVGGPVAYTTAFPAWPGQPITAATPLQVAAGSYSFDPASGQVCFQANFTQRSVVVYNIREFRNDTFKGTSQREMTFLVLTCSTTPPIGGDIGVAGGIDSIPGAPGTFQVCGNVPGWTLTWPVTSPDPTLSITVSATGFTGTGIGFGVAGNGTPAPICSLTGPAGGLPPGIYNIYITMRDNRCPLSGVSNKVISINVYPVPDMTVSTESPITCTRKAYMKFTPSGTGKPWRIRLTDPALAPPSDTLNSWFDSVAVYDSLIPGTYRIVTYSTFTNRCPDTTSFTIANPAIFPTATLTSPTYCGANDGVITLHGLGAVEIDTVRYDKNGFPEPTIVAVSASDGTLPIGGIRGGRTYSNLIVKTGYCISPPLGPLNPINPPFPWSGISSVNPTKCGYCDGEITLKGLHPGQYDSLYYDYNFAAATPLLRFIGADSTIKITGLCQGNYDNFVAVTDSGYCRTTTLGPKNLVHDSIDARFTYVVHHGCSGDTVIFTNTSMHNLADSIEYYTWYFGDGTTSNDVNPVHIYTNSATDTVFNVKMYMSNTKCLDSAFATITLRNFVNADFTITPDNFICQGKDLLITNNTTGGDPWLNPLQYNWKYADGNGSTSPALTHTHAFANVGTYRVMLVANNTVPCYDTAYATIVVDSISGMSMVTTDSVICLGQAITFTGLFSPIGNGRNDSSVVWGFGNGVVMVNKNPVVYAFDQAGDWDVKVQSFYRSCPDTFAIRHFKVIPQPDLYLGPDTAICIGSAPVIIRDLKNGNNSKARYHWSNDETAGGPQMIITKPGTYSATINIDGCSASDTVWVANDCYVSIPNIFTPNGDGVNDYFFPRQLLSKSLTEFTMSIYNRWGQLIYETKAIDGKGWDGMMSNVPQPAGVYVYIIDAKFKDGQNEHHQGNVTIMR